MSREKGYKHSEKTKKKLSEATTKYFKTHPSHKGMKGKHLSEEAKKKISQSLKGGNRGSFKKGHKISEKTHRKMSQSHKGEKNPKWIKDRNKLKDKRLWNSPEGKLWRKAIFERDNYTCKICGDNKGGNLEAHHLLLVSKFPLLRFAINNGLTLCTNCHRKIHQNKKEQ